MDNVHHEQEAAGKGGTSVNACCVVAAPTQCLVLHNVHHEQEAAGKGGKSVNARSVVHA